MNKLEDLSKISLVNNSHIHIIGMTEIKNIVFTKRTFLLLLTGIGLVLFWRGIWEVSAKIFSEEISLIIGLVILVAIAIYERRQIFQFFGGGK